MPRFIEFFKRCPSRAETYALILLMGLIVWTLIPSRASRLEELMQRLEHKIDSMGITQNNSQQIHLDSEATLRDRRIREILAQQNNTGE